MIPIFICNGMLGKLCKLLRMCGIDAAYCNEGSGIILEARKQNRIILTRNTHLKGKDRVFYIEESDSVLQFRKVIQQYNLNDSLHLFSRCLECNSILRPVSKESVKNRIPYYTYTHFDQFAQCTQCLRVYWKGSHYKRMVRIIENALGKLQDQ